MVPDEMSVAVVDFLEVVPVKEQECTNLIGMRCQIIVDSLYTASSIQKTGDRIFLRESGQMSYQFFMFHRRPPFRKHSRRFHRVYHRIA